MFWIGAAPLEPGMPLSPSMPASPASTANATTASHGSPACTTTVPVSRTSMPRDCTRMTVPSNPSSATTTLEPPPSTSHGSSFAQAARAAATSSSLVDAGHERACRSADPHGGEFGEVHQPRARLSSRLTRTCALPSTVWSAKVTVRSTRMPSSSIAPTFATTVTVAPVTGSTTTGRVNRTW